MSDSSTDLLMICGSLRDRSINSAVLDFIARQPPVGVQTKRCALVSLLPFYNPDDDREPLHPAVAELRGQIASSDAVLFCTPEYAGALPGAFKNLLDWTVGGVEMAGKRAAWINAASTAAPVGGEDAHASLRKVLRYVEAEIVEEACVHIPLSRRDLGSDGALHDADVFRRISTAVRVLTQVT